MVQLALHKSDEIRRIGKVDGLCSRRTTDCCRKAVRFQKVHGDQVLFLLRQRGVDSQLYGEAGFVLVQYGGGLPLRRGSFDDSGVYHCKGYHPRGLHRPTLGAHGPRSDARVDSSPVPHPRSGASSSRL